MKNLFKPRKKADATNFLEKILPILKYSLLTIVIITLLAFIVSGLQIMFNYNYSSADPFLGLLTIIISLFVSFIAIIIINIIESLLLGFIIIVENNKKNEQNTTNNEVNK